MSHAAFSDVFYRNGDGLRLHARVYDGPPSLTPVVCLPGLTRNARDFSPIAPQLAATRRVVCLSFRGRGLSDYASDPLTYRPDVELADSCAVLDHLAIARAALLGTSRGGIVALLMAATSPGRVAGIMLNDIGPVLEPAGLLRIRSYLGVPLAVSGWAEAIALLRRNNPDFTNLSPDQWRAFAQRIYGERDGMPVLDYDLALAATFPTVDTITSGAVADFWPLFEALPPLPLALLHGTNSDLLSASTAAAMQDRKPGLQLTHVAERGHAPLLDELESRAAIDRWLAAVDAAESQPRL